MRELKFRVRFGDPDDSETWSYIPFNEALSDQIIDFSEDGLTEDPQGCSIIEQYTGVKDRNGVEIYEGDIVRWNYGNRFEHIGNVVLKNGCFIVAEDQLGFAAMVGDSIDTGAETFKIEVLGNIHENPELLT